jgi:hypothetical protein
MGGSTRQGGDDVARRQALSLAGAGILHRHHPTNSGWAMGRMSRHPSTTQSDAEGVNPITLTWINNSGGCVT